MDTDGSVDTVASGTEPGVVVTGAEVVVAVVDGDVDAVVDAVVDGVDDDTLELVASLSSVRALSSA